MYVTNVQQKPPPKKKKNRKQESRNKRMCGGGKIISFAQKHSGLCVRLKLYAGNKIRKGK